ncbi:hypothetical protein DERF_004580 [Dermatophagoides farinae]|uniref:Transmembrane protein n=1 Tax=Dermatophagoides farinae TaxID=6954 RepID=A0A922L5P3_DERFA|nr:hypothetical protein DERF_004580 [Dermatophagoides farinae]
MLIISHYHYLIFDNLGSMVKLDGNNHMLCAAIYRQNHFRFRYFQMEQNDDRQGRQRKTEERKKKKRNETIVPFGLVWFGLVSFRFSLLVCFPFSFYT